MVRRVAIALVAAVGMTLWIAACGSSPSAPGPGTPPPGGGGGLPTNNQPPRIESITLPDGRVEVDQEISITAVVSDAETALDQLKFEWQADAGTFSGEGPAVRWRVPKGVRTPADYMIRLSVVEAYGTPQNGVRPEHRVTQDAGPVRLHDSVAELSDLALTFLRDFATSSVPAETCVRNFADSCPGKADELEDIRDNRLKFEILSSRTSIRSVSLGGSRPRIVAPCEFTSRIKHCRPDEAGCRVGDVGTVRGDCMLTAVYERNRWWLCDSSFSGNVVPTFKRFFTRR